MAVFRTRLVAVRSVGALLLACAALHAAGDAAIAQLIDSETLLVLRNGKVVEGRITQNSGGYVVDLPKGTMLIPRSLVLMLVASRSDAYRKLKDAAPLRSVAANLALANWCLTNQLYTQARNEIRAALTLDPSSGKARRMMTRLEYLLDPDSTPKTKAKPTFEERLMRPSVKSLAGLSRESARLFVSKVQPILMNNCATAGCHGPKSENGFRLSRVGLLRGSRRGATEQNLATTLRYVNPQHPTESALLTKPTGNHGRRGRPVFRGSAGARQHGLLRRWAFEIAEDSATPIATKSSLAAKKRSGRSTLPPGFQSTPAMRAIRSQAEQRRLVNDIRSDGRKDVFDPAEFNRSTAKKNRGRPSTEGRIR